MSLLESIILFDVVKIIPADDSSSVHLQFGNNTGEDAATNGAFASEWAFFVNVMTFASLYQI